MKLKLQAFLVGLTGFLVLLLLYFGILGLTGSFSFAWHQFKTMWFWLIPLAVGFGVQVGLFTYGKLKIKQQSLEANTSVAVSGSVSAVSMVACCAHHIADLLPFLGLSAAAVFLTRFQIPLIILGLLSNMFGILIMLKTLRKHQLI